MRKTRLFQLLKKNTLHFICNNIICLIFTLFYVKEETCDFRVERKNCPFNWLSLSFRRLISREEEVVSKYHYICDNRSQEWVSHQLSSKDLLDGSSLSSFVLRETLKTLRILSDYWICIFQSLYFNLWLCSTDTSHPWRHSTGLSRS